MREIKRSKGNGIKKEMKEVERREMKEMDEME